MSKLKNALIVGGGVLLLGSIATLMNHGSITPKLHADDRDDRARTVTIGSPLPLPTSSVDDPGRTPYQFFKNLQPCTSTCSVTTPAVPAGKRLVVQHVSAFGALTSAGSFVEVVVSSNTTVISTFAPLIFGHPGNQGFAFDQTVLGYADAGATVNVFISSDGNLNNTASDFVVTGYLVDCTVAQCAPIAP